MQAPQLTGLAEDDIGLLARIHYATHTADFSRARAFYRALGYSVGFGDFPLTNTHQMARALGMFDLCQYELEVGEVIALPDAPSPAAIDLLQFKVPFNDEPPYELPNHLGMAYAAFASADFDADVAALTALGVPMLSAPAMDHEGRFVFFRDPDGVLYRLQEGSGAVVPGRGMQIYDMPYIAINVSNLGQSIAFYERLGYEVQGAIADQEGDAATGAAWGLDGPYRYRTVDITAPRGDRHRLRLTQWLMPYDPAPPYPAPINHIGIHRIAVLVSDLDRAVGILKAQGVPFLSELAPCCSGTGEDESGIVHVLDPDGVFVELVGAIARRGPQPQPDHCPALQIRYPARAN
ncbi:MAG: VOC family protein [Pseudomonadota bacterium]